MFTILAIVGLTICGVLPLANSQDLPHVSDCNLCYKCHYTKDKDPNALPAKFPEPETDAHLKIVPSKAHIAAKEAKRNCSECWGCSTQIQPLKDVMAFGHKFTVELGASPEWLFHADLPDTHITGQKAIVKVWCMPIDKVTGKMRWKCDNTEIAIRGSQHLVALDKVTRECGLDDVTIKVWLAPVNAVVPGLGVHVSWYGLWMERAHGLSMNQLAYIGKRDLVERTIMDLMQEKMNKTRVVRAAIYDLLIAQCDRHAQNVFIDEHGAIKLIDNLNSLKFSWEHCSQDSIFLPGTQKFEIIRFGGNLVTKRLGARARKSTNPLILLDYRCYVEGGKIGTAYPEPVTQCLRKISSLPPVDIKKQYGFSDTRIAEVLSTRAADMLQRGYEWTLKRGKPVNKAPMRYKWQQPCCRLSYGQKHILKCAHDWNITAQFPVGDPLRGGPWRWTYPDPGAYDGDKAFS